nr:uncharacterized protein CTRU02_05862 [Colletotrichum truncatum]KAF6793607.1 hypothetical protein CTRU02_05862 [Colletotrichum truncatum]
MELPNYPGIADGLVPKVPGRPSAPSFFFFFFLLPLTITPASRDRVDDTAAADPFRPSSLLHLTPPLPITTTTADDADADAATTATKTTTAQTTKRIVIERG